VGLEALDPVLDRARGVAQDLCHLGTGQSLGHQQDAVQPVIVAGFFRASDLIVERQNNVLPVGHHEWFHAVEDTTVPHYAQLLMTLCIE
jgi:hypothetical protein